MKREKELKQSIRTHREAARFESDKVLEFVVSVSNANRVCR